MSAFVLRIMTFITLFIASIITLTAQRPIDGNIRDSRTREPIIGATIMIIGSDQGTVTDEDGNFNLSVTSAQDSIRVSYVGYIDQFLRIDVVNHIEIMLEEDLKILDEVVVVGYGTQKKSDVTGAMASVKGDELVKQPVLTATQALQGKVAGVQIISSGEPGTNPVVRVRGVSSALGGTATLFVVDGVLTDDISNINTNDIVSMDILKDASATAIYGARGANGVIIITTKKGLSGDPAISYSTNVGIKNATNLVEMANDQEYANYVQAATGSAIELTGTNTSWYDEILRSAWFQNHNLSLNGGTERAKYYISSGYLVDEGIVLDNKFKRYNVRTNLDFTLAENLKTGITGSFTGINNNISNLGTAYNNAYRAAPIIESRVGDKYGNTSNYQNVGNPVLDIENNKNLFKGSRVQASTFLEYAPVSWLKLRSSIGGDLINTNGRVYNYAFENDTSTFLVPGGNQRNEFSNLSINRGNSLWWVWDNTATFEKSFGEHTFSLLAGTTAEQFAYQWISGFRRDVPANEDLWYLGVGDANTSTNDGGGDKWRRNAYLSRLNYNFDDRYMFTGTLRYDGSSRLSEDNRWGLFPSAGFSWLISNEGFMADQKLFDYLKFRTSWGKVGNDRVPTDAFVVTLDPNKAYPFGGGTATLGNTISQIKDPNLKWETTEEFDLGLEFGFLNNRLTGELGFYDKKARDLLIYIKVPSVVGDADGQVLTNAASIENKGLELALNWRTKVSDKLSYNLGINGTYNKNNVIGLNGGQPILDGGVGAEQGFTTKTDNGHEVGEFFVLNVEGVFQNQEEIVAYQKDGKLIQPNAVPGDFKYSDTNSDGVIDDDDRIFVGSYQPKFYMGLNGGLSIGAFDFSIGLFGNLGNKIYNGKKAFRQLAEDNVEKEMAYSRWTSGSGINDEPRANNGRLLASTYFVESGDYFRINNATVGYNLPSRVAERLTIESLRVFFSGQNLYTLMKYSGFTPELPGNPTSAGIEKNAYPTSRVMTLGINLTF